MYDGISQIPFRRGQLLVWDYSCIDPLAPSNHAINILDQKEQLKISKYTEIINDHCFIPIISTTLGTFGKLALAFFKKLGSQISKLSEEPREGECYLPKLKGPCKAFFPRYHYDPEQERCRFFTYGGCKGNGNNFESMGDCERACIPNETVTATTLTIFSLPSNYTTILSKSNITKYYYTDQEDICKPFIFTGCGGNKNNFDDEENCNHLCKKKLLKDSDTSTTIIDEAGHISNDSIIYSDVNMLI
ncbi:actinia tenebrosa protease inhibitors-like [Gordionus sp. m RMFG-2023]|uniref:actinia tenebrosa protease inhibitors-like n=1 Tax=Gordionus sp. m RMFG-2023 TaxID=3053472 RepID=UPI0031FCC5EF